MCQYDPEKCNLTISFCAIYHGGQCVKLALCKIVLIHKP